MGEDASPEGDFSRENTVALPVALNVRLHSLGLLFRSV